MTYNEALKLLNLENGYDNNSLKKVYRMMLRKYHPDFYEQSSKEAKMKALEMTKKLNEAYEILSKAQPKYNNYYEYEFNKTKKETLIMLDEMLKNLDKNSEIPYDYFITERFILTEAIDKIKSANIEVEIFVLIRNMKKELQLNSQNLYEQLLSSYNIKELPFYKLIVPIYLNYKKINKNFDSVVEAYDYFTKMKDQINSEIEDIKTRYSNKISFRMNRILENYQTSQYYQFIEEKVNPMVELCSNQILVVYSLIDYYSNKSKYDKEINIIYKELEKNISKYLGLAQSRIEKMKNLYLKFKKLGYKEQKIDRVIEPLADNLFDPEFRIKYGKLLLVSFIEEKQFNSEPIEIKRKVKKL